MSKYPVERGQRALREVETDAVEVVVITGAAFYEDESDKAKKQAQRSAADQFFKR